MSGQFEAACVSVTGDRSVNQDRALMLTRGPTTLLCVADGLGGHPRGEVAAQLVVDVCEAQFRHEAKPLHDPERFMLHCMHKAHQAIVAYGDRQDPPISPRSTAVIALVQQGQAYWLHAGDSRLYLLRNGQVQARTHDHSRSNEASGSPQQSARLRSSVTRCLGGLDQPPVITAGPPTELCDGDVLLLCSDGLWGQLKQDKLVAALKGDRPIKKVVRRLAASAQRHAAPHSDNITALALRWHAAHPPSPERAHVADVVTAPASSAHHASSLLT